LLVDGLGLILSSIVLPANVQDRQGALHLLSGKKHFLPKLTQIYADGGYEGREFAKEVKQAIGAQVTVIKRLSCQGFVPLPKRWIVERTFAWLNKCRRLSKDYELKVQTSESLIYVAMTRIMLRRLIL